ncbi:hypothetical protein AOLI_G00068290 [Acnodon oligacanthus]
MNSSNLCSHQRLAEELAELTSDRFCSSLNTTSQPGSALTEYLPAPLKPLPFYGGRGEDRPLLTGDSECRAALRAERPDGQERCGSSRREPGQRQSHRRRKARGGEERPPAARTDDLAG